MPDSAKSLVRRFAGALIPCVFLCTFLSACGTSPSGGLLNKSLELVGLQTIDTAALAAQKAEIVKTTAANRLPLRIHAGAQLNSDGVNRPLPLVVKIFKLKGYESFARAPYSAFAEGSLKSEELLSSREMVLLPGQRYEVEERLPTGTTHIGVVALFRSPDAHRWRFVFELNSTAKEGVTLGAHQCALSVAQGMTVGSAPEFKRLAGAICR